MQNQLKLRYPEEFRIWYYDTIVKRDWDGKPNTKARRGDQSKEQLFFDAHRKFMGFDAPFTNIDMLSYDHGEPLALIEVKFNDEQWDIWNKTAVIRLAEKANLPVYLFRVYENSGVIDSIAIEKY